MNNIPTLDEIYQDLIARVETKLNVSISSLPDAIFNSLRVECAAKSAVLKQMYLVVGKLQKNIFPDTAESEATGGTLERFGRAKLNRNPFQPEQGKYTVTVTGDPTGVIDAETTWRSDDNSTNPGMLYILDEAHSMAGSTDSITLRALTAGTTAKLVIGDTLTATTPLNRIDQQVTVTAEAVQPKDVEDIEDYRAKTLQAFRLEPQGGAASDYRLWGYDAQGVREIYPYAKSGANNEEDVYVEATMADSDDGMGTPGAGILADVAEVIERDPDTTKPLTERGRRPDNVQVNVLPVTIKEIDITVHGYTSITTDKQTAILDALTALIYDIRPFVAAADILDNRNDTLSKNVITGAILNAVPGSIFSSIDLEVDGSPVDTVTFDLGNIPHLNSVSYV